MSTISVATSSQHFAQTVAKTVSLICENSGSQNNVVSIALAGGNTPIDAYKELVNNPVKYPINWKKIHLFLSDERLVPTNDVESNQGHIHPIFSPTGAHCIWPDVSFAIPALAAQAYEQKVFNQVGTKNALIQFDCILLGIGPDGHTASIFPQSKEIAHQSKRLVIPVTDSPKPPSNRISFSLRLINSTKQVIILATGEQKAAIVKSVVLEEAEALAYPIAHVKPIEGSVHWILDQSAASHLPQSVLK